MIWCPPPRHSWQKLALLLISLQRVEKERKGQTMEKPPKWKFLDSLFKSHPSPKALRTCLDLPAGSPASPQHPSGPPRLSAAGPGDALLQPHVLPGLWAACQPRQSGKLHTLESDGESAHCVLSEGQDWLQIPQTLVHGTRPEKTEATAVVHELLQQTFQLFSPRALLQVETRASWTDSSWDLISSWRTWTRVWGREGHWKSHL